MEEIDFDPKTMVSYLSVPDASDLYRDFRRNLSKARHLAHIYRRTSRRDRCTEQANLSHVLEEIRSDFDAGEAYHRWYASNRSRDKEKNWAKLLNAMPYNMRRRFLSCKARCAAKVVDNIGLVDAIDRDFLGLFGEYLNSLGLKPEYDFEEAREEREGMVEDKLPDPQQPLSDCVFGIRYNDFNLLSCGSFKTPLEQTSQVYIKSQFTFERDRIGFSVTFATVPARRGLKFLIDPIPQLYKLDSRSRPNLLVSPNHVKEVKSAVIEASRLAAENRGKFNDLCGVEDAMFTVKDTQLTDLSKKVARKALAEKARDLTKEIWAPKD